MKPLRDLATALLPVAVAPVRVVAVRAADTYPSLKIGTNILINVRVIQTTPADLLLGFDGGYQRIKLQDLPDELKAKHPYDAQKAAAYEREKTAQERATQAQIAAQDAAAFQAARRPALLQRESELKARLASLQTEMARLDADIGTQAGIARGKNSDLRRAEDWMRCAARS